jgi:hypothetical protein
MVEVTLKKELLSILLEAKNCKETMPVLIVLV